MRKEIIGHCELYLGDCRDVMPMLPRVDAVLTDPPYGIGESGGERHGVGAGRTRFFIPKHEDLHWETERPSEETFALVMNAAPLWFLFGGNYFADLLPPSMGWLYWNKRLGGRWRADLYKQENGASILRHQLFSRITGNCGSIQPKNLSRS